MYRQKKSLKRIVCSAICGAVIAYAALPIGVTAKQISDTKVEYNINFGQKGKYVIMVFRPEKSADDVRLGENSANIIAYENQGETTEDGSLSVSFNIDGESGDYPVSVYFAGDGSIRNDVISFVNMTDFKTAIEGLNILAKTEKVKPSDVAKYIDDNRKNLNFEKSNDASDTDVAAIIINDIKDAEYDGTNFAASNDRYDRAVLIASLNNNKCKNMFENENLFLNETSGFADFFGVGKKYEKNDIIKSAVTARASGKSLTSSKQLFDILPTALALSVIENPNGVQNVKDIMSVYMDLFAARTISASDDALNKAMGKSYKNISDFDSAVSAAGESGNKPSAGGSGGGGGGSRNSMVAVKSENPDDGSDNGRETIPNDVYVDLDDAIWARNAIVSLTNLGVLRGTGPDTFEPNKNVTREEFVKMIVATFIKDKASESKASKFGDVDLSDWYAPYIDVALEKGIVNGISDDYFGIGENITRQDMAVMAYRAAMSTYTAEENSAEKFDDYSSIDDYAKDAVNVMVKQGIINGTDNNLFAPADFATRAQAAKIIYEMYRVLY